MAEDLRHRPTDADYIEIVRVLLQHNADTRARDKWGRTALMRASREGYREMVRLLLDWEADVHAKDQRGYTALMYAAWYGHADIVKDLIERGADVNVFDHEEGWTPLMLAAGGVREEAGDDLSEIGAEDEEEDE